MSASQALTLLVAVIYAGTLVAHLAAGRVGFALMFFGYALANIGLIIAEPG